MKMFVLLYHPFCTYTIFQNIIPSLFPESFHNLDGTGTSALKDGMEQCVM